MITRRTFHKLAIAAFARVNSKIDGVMIGAQTYSFRDRDLDACIAGMKEVGLGYAELYQGHVEPKGDALAAWRKNPPLDELRGVRKKFDDAGIELYAFNYSFREDWTDEELARGFDMAKALGVKYITSSSNVSTAKRLDPLAAKNQIYVAFHNHSNIKPNEFARPEDFEQALNGASKYLAINLDIGHFSAAGFDPVSFLEQHHERIITLHIKDRKNNQGPGTPFGEGDTPIKQVLQVLKTKRYPIPANIEYEYKGGDTIVEMKRCFAYCRTALG
jgi:sugar phosphate isomerase/epimerase